jgi:hypothetical protein
MFHAFRVMIDKEHSSSKLNASLLKFVKNCWEILENYLLKKNKEMPDF